MNAAYEILGDDDKRKAFDRGEIDAEGKPRFQGFDGGAGGGFAGAGGRGDAFRELHLGPGRIPARRRRRPRAAASQWRHRRHSKEMFGGARRRRPRLAVRAGGLRRRPAASDVTEHRHGHAAEVATRHLPARDLPTGKESTSKFRPGLLTDSRSG